MERDESGEQGVSGEADDAEEGVDWEGERLAGERDERW